MANDRLTLTDEQLAAVAKFRSQESLKVTAFAGTGKTSTLVAMASVDARTGLYLAFNRSIATEAKLKFARSVECRTVHSLAFQSVKSRYDSTSKLIDSLSGNAVASLLSLREVPLPTFVLRPASLGSLVHRTVLSFCQSADDHIQGTHMPVTGKIAALSRGEQQRLSEHVASIARQLWERMVDPSDATPLGHDGYLKLWALSRPTIACDYIMLDEAQDTNAVVMHVLARQPAQMVFVGDAHQQIYEWRGAVNAMENIKTAHHSYLTMSFRFGDPIAGAANRILRMLGETRALRGSPTQLSELGTIDYDACLCRTNATLMSELIQVLSHGMRVHVLGGVGDLRRLLDGVQSLQDHRPTDVPELFGFTNWDDVRTAAQDNELSELVTLVNLVERFTVSMLKTAVSRAEANESAAEVVLSTVHKAKGREWKRVRLADDFLLGLNDEAEGQKKRKSMHKEEVRIAYVAVTRAKTAVYIPPSLRTAFGILQDAKYDDHHVNT